MRTKLYQTRAVEEVVEEAAKRTDPGKNKLPSYESTFSRYGFTLICTENADKNEDENHRAASVLLAASEGTLQAAEVCHAIQPSCPLRLTVSLIANPDLSPGYAGILQTRATGKKGASFTWRSRREPREESEEPKTRPQAAQPRQQPQGALPCTI